MSDLVVFLRLMYDEEEAAAKVVLEDPDYAADWHEQSSGVLYVGPGSEQHPLDGLQPMGDSRLARFIAEHDPARVLREVEAKRRILALHERPLQYMPGPYYWQAVTAALRALAAIYSDHPDYDPGADYTPGED